MGKEGGKLIFARFILGAFMTWQFPKVVSAQEEKENLGTKGQMDCLYGKRKLGSLAMKRGERKYNPTKYANC